MAGGDSLQGKKIEMVARDIADGYIFVNPIFMKRITPETAKDLLAAINKMMILVRNEKFPTGDIEAIKRRNLHLSRLNAAVVVIKNFAKERRWQL